MKNELKIIDNLKEKVNIYEIEKENEDELLNLPYLFESDDEEESEEKENEKILIVNLPYLFDENIKILFDEKHILDVKV